MKLKVITIFALGLALLLSACGKSDADLQKAAMEKLTSEKVSGVSVAVKDGVATLSGEVADITVKNKAESAVKGVDGIKSVDNKVTLKPLPTPEPPSEDKKLQGMIEEGLKKKSIGGINVNVSDGVVTLTGDVAKDKLAEVMATANEAKPKKVENKLTVK